MDIEHHYAQSTQLIRNKIWSSSLRFLNDWRRWEVNPRLIYSTQVEQTRTVSNPETAFIGVKHWQRWVTTVNANECPLTTICPINLAFTDKRNEEKDQISVSFDKFTVRFSKGLVSCSQLWSSFISARTRQRKSSCDTIYCTPPVSKTTHKCRNILIKKAFVYLPRPSPGWMYLIKKFDPKIFRRSI